MDLSLPDPLVMEATKELHGQGEDDRAVLLGRDGVQGLQVPARHRHDDDSDNDDDDSDDYDDDLIL